MELNTAAYLGFDSEDFWTNWKGPLPEPERGELRKFTGYYCNNVLHTVVRGNAISAVYGGGQDKGCQELPN